MGIKKVIASHPMLLLTVILMEILGGTEMDLFVPSFPEIQQYFSITPLWVAALLSVNFSGYCLSLLFVGGFSDYYGRKPIITLGLLIFIFGSILCLLAPSYPVLLVGRFLQGLGVAAPANLCFLIIADIYALKEQQYIMAMLNGFINASIGVAPVIGSYITQSFAWQGNFVALLLLSLLVLIMSGLYTPTHVPPKQRETLSLRGYLPLFRSKPLLLMSTIIIFMCVPYWVFIGISPLLFMKSFGVSITNFGFYQGAMATVYALGSVLAGPMIQRFNQRRLLSVSTYICALGGIAIFFAALFNLTNPLMIVLLLMPYIIGTIIPNTLIYPMCINLIPQAKGRISALMHAIRLLLTAGGLELAAYYYNGSFQSMGLILAGSFMVAIIALFIFIRNHTLMHSLVST